jgi:hypothetical protein
VAEPEGAIEAIEYEQTGDAGLDVALSFMGNLGIGLDHPGMAAAMEGNFAILEAHLATLGDKARGFQQMLALAKDAQTRHAEKATNTANAVTAAVHGVAGGADEWAKIQQWAAGEATPEEKAQINALFDSGVMGARAAAKLLTDQYRAAKGTVINPRDATRNPGANSALSTTGPLSPREYHAAVTELRTKLGNRMDASPEYAALRSRLRR